MFNIGVIGIGFLGGSLVKSLSKSDKVNEIIALDKNVDSLKKAYEDKVITEYTTEVDESFKKCDIVFICTPVSFVTDYAKELKNCIAFGCAFPNKNNKIHESNEFVEINELLM